MMKMDNNEIRCSNTDCPMPTGRMKKNKETDQEEFVLFQSVRDPHKGYKSTVNGILRDNCFKAQQMTTVLKYGCPDEHYGGYEGVKYTVNTFFWKNDLWNRLATIDREDRVKYRVLTTDPVLEARITPLEIEKEGMRLICFQKEKSKQRTKKPTLPPATQEIINKINTEMMRLVYFPTDKEKKKVVRPGWERLKDTNQVVPTTH